MTDSKPHNEPSSGHIDRSSRSGISSAVGRLDRKVTRLAVSFCGALLVFGCGQALAFYQRDQDLRRREHEECVDSVQARAETREVFYAITDPYADTEVGRQIRATIDEVRPAQSVQEQCGDGP